MDFKRLAVLLALSILLSPADAAPLKRCRLAFINSTNQRIPLDAELALTHEEKGRGLMFRSRMDENSGMLFVFDREQMMDFWIKNTYIPLSIAYIDSEGIIREIYDMKPLDISISYPSKYPARYALEVNRGWFSRKGIRKGSRLILNGCIGQQDTILR